MHKLHPNLIGKLEWMEEQIQLDAEFEQEWEQMNFSANKALGASRTLNDYCSTSRIPLSLKNSY
jgi:hypothetical protein